MIPPSKSAAAQNRLRTPPVPETRPAASGARRPSGVSWFQNPQDIPYDLIRRIAVTGAAAGAAVTTALLARTDESTGGGITFTGEKLAGAEPQAVLGAAGSLLAPAAAVWWLWVPIAAGWLGYALYQWLPRQRANPRHRRLGWFILAFQILAFAWLLAVSSGSAGFLLAVASAQIIAGLFAVRSMNRHPVASRMEGLLTDVPQGFSLAAGVFSFTAALSFILTAEGTDLAGWGGNVWALVGLITVTVGTVAICMTDRGHLSVALASVWALCCVAFERLTGAPDSTVVGAAAAAAAFLVLVSAGSRRHQVDHERRREERHNERRRQADAPELASA